MDYNYWLLTLTDPVFRQDIRIILITCQFLTRVSPNVWKLIRKQLLNCFVCVPAPAERKIGRTDAGGHMRCAGIMSPQVGGHKHVTCDMD